MIWFSLEIKNKIQNWKDNVIIFQRPFISSFHLDLSNANFIPRNETGWSRWSPCGQPARSRFPEGNNCPMVENSSLKRKIFYRKSLRACLSPGISAIPDKFSPLCLKIYWNKESIVKNYLRSLFYFWTFSFSFLKIEIRISFFLNFEVQ